MIALPFFSLEETTNVSVLRLQSADGTNRLTYGCVLALRGALGELANDLRPIVIAGNVRFFSAGAELSEIAALGAASAYEFSGAGQSLMSAIEHFPASVCAAISGYCMGGGLDLALACHRRIAAPNAVFGHRGAALGLMTGWGGTQRLPRVVGKVRALEMLVTAEKIDASRALEIGLIDAIADDPIAQAVRILNAGVGAATRL